MAKQDDYTRYTIRIPAILYDALKIAAGNKSVNAEIIDRLERSFKTPIDDSAYQKEKLSELVKTVIAETLERVPIEDLKGLKDHAPETKDRGKSNCD